MAADDLWGSRRKVTVGYREHGEEWYRQARYEDINDMAGSDQTILRMGPHLGVTIVDVFRYPKVVETMLAANHDEMHKPKPKMAACRAFPEFFKSGPFYRDQSSLQVNSGMREWHDVLLSTRYNKRGNIGIMGVYNDIAKEMGIR